MNPKLPTTPASEAARLLGSVKSPKKTASSRENGKLGGRPARSPEDYKCKCGLCPDNPKTTCPRGRAIRRRLKAKKPLG